MKEETKYLGFIIDKKGIKPDLDKGRSDSSNA